ncbi:Phosphoglycerate mutase-like protein 1, partial [Mucuna pruriens]
MSMITVGVSCGISTLTSTSSFPSSLRFRSAFPLLSPPSALCFSGLSKNMDCGGGPGPCVFPLNHCKTVHLIRHGQGIHNVEGDKDYNAYMKPEYFDAHLTPLGWQEVDNLRKHVHDSGLIKRIDLVIASPLLRTLQTAVGVFGGEGYTDRTDVLPLMVANAGNSSRTAISSLNCPPIVAVELCREHLLIFCISFLKLVIDDVNIQTVTDFSMEFVPVTKEEASASINFYFLQLIFHWQIDSNEDTLWKADIRETKEELAARGLKFMNWLGTIKEKEIAIVTHRAFLFHTLSAFGNYSHPLVKKELSKHFANCELRSMVIVDWYE